jgi:hypothetical protein
MKKKVKRRKYPALKKVNLFQVKVRRLSHLGHFDFRGIE